LCLRTMTGGKPQIDIMKAKLYRSKKYGNYIYAPHRKIVVPRFDQNVFLPRRQSGRMFLDISASDGYYYPNKWKSLLKIMRKEIGLFDENGKEEKFATKEQVDAFLKKKYKLQDYNDFGGMVNQIPHVDRAQALINDEIIANLNQEKLSFWKSPQFIWITTLAIAGTLAIVIIILAMKHAETLAPTVEPAKGALHGLAESLGGNVSTGSPPSP